MIQYKQEFTANMMNGVAAFYGNPLGYKQGVDAETMHKMHTTDPGKGPHRDPRDIYVLLGAVIGILVCCTIGVVIGALIWGFGGMFIGIVVGIFVGGFGGSYLGERIKKAKYETRHNTSEEKEAEERSRGPS